MNTRGQRELLPNPNQVLASEAEGALPPNRGPERYVQQALFDESVAAKGRKPVSMEELWGDNYVYKAIRHVQKNKGAPGIDGMEVKELDDWFKDEWKATKQDIAKNRYRPQPLRHVQLRKAGGGMRNIGIPTVADRVIQQVIATELNAIFDSGFSESSFGYRPNKSAHGAIKAAKGYIEEGYRFVVNIDLDSFFDRVQHDVLRNRLRRKIDNLELVKLIGKLQKAGIVMDHGICQERTMGVPQGSPLSPVLANIMLDQLDKELEKRGHKFVRYADDIAIFVKSERAAKRVLEQLSAFITKALKLKVNESKSKITQATNTEMLGFRFYISAKGKVGIWPSTRSINNFRYKVRRLTRRAWGTSMRNRIEKLNEYTRSWMSYFRITNGKKHMVRLDEWIRRRLRQAQWAQWPKVKTRIANLRKLGASPSHAYQWGCTSLGSWKISGSWILQTTLTNEYWKNQGVKSLEDLVQGT